MSATTPSGDSLDYKLPRGLIVLCCIWIAASWIMLFGVRPPVQPVSSSYADNVTMMSMLTMLGITIAWPLLRTSGPPFNAPIRQTCLDMLVLACGVEIVFWPLRLLTNWSVGQTGAIVLVITLWILLYGSIIWLGAGTPRPRRRALAMAIAVLLSLGGLVIARDQPDIWWNPMSTARTLTTGVMNDPVETAIRMAVPLSLATIGMWLLLVGLALLWRRSGG